MNQPAMRWAFGALLLLAAALIGVWRLSARPPEEPRVAVGGGDAGGLPRARPEDQHFDAVALERIVQDGAADALQVLVIMRNGEVVFERYGRGITPDTMIDSGPFAEVLVALLGGVAAQEGTLSMPLMHGFEPTALRVAIETGTEQRYELYLSRHLWRPVNAAAAWIALPASGAATPADCCFHARVLDWMRIAGLLVDGGRFEGKQIVPAAWLQRMTQPNAADEDRGFGVELAASARGAEPFAAQGVFFLRGPSRWRLWLVPALKLAVLFGAAAPSASAPATAAPAPMGPAFAATSPTWDETRIPNLVIRALSDRPPQPGDATDLRRLVPGH